VVATSEALVTSTLILLSPLILALPLSVGWKWWVGSEPEHEHYTEKVRSVLDAGIPLRRYRAELDSEARRFMIDPERQARIESNLLHPLRIQHFLLLPSLIVWPVLGLFAAVIAIPLMPVLRAIEWIMIDKKALAKSTKVLQNITRWERSRSDFSAQTPNHRLPRTIRISRSTLSSFGISRNSPSQWGGLHSAGIYHICNQGRYCERSCVC